MAERIDQRGFSVAHVSEADFAELLKTRAWLDERALRESIANGDRQWQEAVVLAHYRPSKTPRTPAPEKARARASAPRSSVEREQCHRAFHFALLVACGSTMLLRFCQQLYDQNIRYRFLSGRSAYPKRDRLAQASAGSSHGAITRACEDAIKDVIISGRKQLQQEDLLTALNERQRTHEPDDA